MTIVSLFRFALIANRFEEKFGSKLKGDDLFLLRVPNGMTATDEMTSFLANARSRTLVFNFSVLAGAFFIVLVLPRLWKAFVGL
jgi:hypothetical protein